MSFEAREIAERIAVAAADEMDLPPAVARDVAFHMTDWLGDLEALLAFYRQPSALSNEQVADLLARFLVHVPNHIAAAAKLYTGFPVCDVFHVGALEKPDGDAGLA